MSSVTTTWQGIAMATTTQSTPLSQHAANISVRASTATAYHSDPKGRSVETVCPSAAFILWYNPSTSLLFFGLAAFIKLD
jgi:hypothetical protein